MAAYDSPYQREFTLTSLKNLKTVVDNTRTSYTQSSLSSFMGNYGWTLLGFSPFSPLAAGAAVASFMFATVNEMKSNYKSDLDGASAQIDKVIGIMGAEGDTKCRAKGGAIYSNDNGSFVPYDFQVIGYYKNGQWQNAY